MVRLRSGVVGWIAKRPRRLQRPVCSLTCSLACYLESTQQNRQEGAEPSSLYRYRSRRPRWRDYVNSDSSMAFDERLAERRRRSLGRREGLVEKQMFSGVAFLLNGNMCLRNVRGTVLGKPILEEWNPREHYYGIYTKEPRHLPAAPSRQLARRVTDFLVSVSSAVPPRWTPIDRTDGTLTAGGRTSPSVRVEQSIHASRGQAKFRTNLLRRF